VAITSPVSGTVSGLVPVDVTATDNVALARVELYVNGSLNATDTLDPYGFTFDSTKYQDGQVTLQARAYDATGNAAPSSTVTVDVDNTPTTATTTTKHPHPRNKK
jgi:hypothetical protein